MRNLFSEIIQGLEVYHFGVEERQGASLLPVLWGKGGYYSGSSMEKTQRGRKSGYKIFGRKQTSANVGEFE